MSKKKNVKIYNNIHKKFFDINNDNLNEFLKNQYFAFSFEQLVKEAKVNFTPFLLITFCDFFLLKFCCEESCLQKSLRVTAN